MSYVGNKKTNNAFIDKTFPGVSVSNKMENESVVEQVAPGKEVQMGRTGAKIWCSCPIKENAYRKQDLSHGSCAKNTPGLGWTTIRLVGVTSSIRSQG